MPTLTKRCCMCLLVLPVLAWADPVRVATHSAGMSSANNIVLNALGLNSVPTGTLLPYELTLISTFDTDKNPSSSQTVHDDGRGAIELHIGDQVLRYEGNAYKSASMYAQSSGFDSYTHMITFDTPGSSPVSGYRLSFFHQLYYVPDDKQPGTPLAPLDVDERDGVVGGDTIWARPSNPDVPLNWLMGGEGSTISAHVAVVPEPPSFALLGAGMSTLGFAGALAMWRAARAGQRRPPSSARPAIPVPV